MMADYQLLERDRSTIPSPLMGEGKGEGECPPTLVLPHEGGGNAVAKNCCSAISAAEQLQEFLRGKTLVLGIGNAMLGDDGAGPRLIELLRPAEGPDLRVIDGETAPERHLGEVEAAQPGVALLVDAVDWGGAPGEIAFLDEENLPPRACTTHDVSLRLVLQYLRLSTGAKVGLLGIQPAQTRFGAGLSPEVEETVRRVAEMLGARGNRQEARRRDAERTAEDARGRAWIQ